MIDIIKKAVRGYLSNEKLTSIMLGTVTGDGVKVGDKLTIPNELIKGNLKDYVGHGDKVRLIRNHGGQEFYIVEIIGSEFVRKGSMVLFYDIAAEVYKEYLVSEVSK